MFRLFKCGLFVLYLILFLGFYFELISSHIHDFSRNAACPEGFYIVNCCSVLLLVLQLETRRKLFDDVELLTVSFELD